ncbi:uncharacterized protein LOC115246260 [Formica exsecta]|uniref:uncharacterized protein LOC115246260 n=1 Tax=Formica exsecta TaxID=72781 RepID=UPI001144835F|nr:uncharacterized protein LOC115246260 [Formica exsecta]
MQFSVAVRETTTITRELPGRRANEFSRAEHVKPARDHRASHEGSPRGGHNESRRQQVRSSPIVSPSLRILLGKRQPTLPPTLPKDLSLPRPQLPPISPGTSREPPCEGERTPGLTGDRACTSFREWRLHPIDLAPVQYTRLPRFFLNPWDIRVRRYTSPSTPWDLPPLLSPLAASPLRLRDSWTQSQPAIRIHRGTQCPSLELTDSATQPDSDWETTTQNTATQTETVSKEPSYTPPGTPARTLTCAAVYRFPPNHHHRATYHLAETLSALALNRPFSGPPELSVLRIVHILWTQSQPAIRIHRGTQCPTLEVTDNATQPDSDWETTTQDTATQTKTACEEHSYTPPGTPSVLRRVPSPVLPYIGSLRITTTEPHLAPVQYTRLPRFFLNPWDIRVRRYTSPSTPWDLPPLLSPLAASPLRLRDSWTQSQPAIRIHRGTQCPSLEVTDNATQPDSDWETTTQDTATQTKTACEEHSYTPPGTPSVLRRVPSPVLPYIGSLRITTTEPRPIVSPSLRILLEKRQPTLPPTLPKDLSLPRPQLPPTSPGISRQPSIEGERTPGSAGDQACTSFRKWRLHRIELAPVQYTRLPLFFLSQWDIRVRRYTSPSTPWDLPPLLSPLAASPLRLRDSWTQSQPAIRIHRGTQCPSLELTDSATQPDSDWETTTQDTATQMKTVSKEPSYTPPGTPARTLTCAAVYRFPPNHHHRATYHLAGTLSALSLNRPFSGPPELR